MPNYDGVLFAFLAVALIVSLSGIAGVVLMVKYLSKNIARISSTIAAQGLNRVRAQTKREIISDLMNRQYH